MKKISILFLLVLAFTTAFAQRERDDEYKKQLYNQRLLEEKIKIIESNHRFQVENLQAQMIALSAKDTARQKQLLSTLQLYLEQADKKYAQELAALRVQKESRVNETDKIVQGHTNALQSQINQQASLLLYGGLGTIALCILLFLIGLKIARDQQERSMREMADKQQVELKKLIYSGFRKHIGKELKRYLDIDHKPAQNADKVIELLQGKIKELEDKLASQTGLINAHVDATDTEEVVFDKEIAADTAPTEEISTLIEVSHNPNDVSVKTDQILEETLLEPLQEQIELYTPTITETTTTPTTPTIPEDNEENDAIIKENTLSGNRDWVEEIEQKINLSLQKQEVKNVEEEEEKEEKEEIVYAKNTDPVQPAPEESITSPEYNKIIEEAGRFYEQKDYKKAIELYSDALSLNQNYLAYTRRANCFHIIKQYDRAAEDYEKAIRLKKDFIPAYNNAIEIYILTDNFFQALTLLERLSQIEKVYSYKAVELYLKLIAQKGLMQNTEKTEKELDTLMRESFTFNFSVREIEDWLMTADIDGTDKKMIRVKTELLKMKKEYSTIS